MKISVKINKEAIECLYTTLQNLSQVHPTTREQRANKSILEEVLHKITQARLACNGKKPKKLNFKYHQASVLEYFLRGMLSSPHMGNLLYHSLTKVANELHQQLA